MQASLWYNASGRLQREERESSGEGGVAPDAENSSAAQKKKQSTRNKDPKDLGNRKEQGNREKGKRYQVWRKAEGKQKVKSKKQKEKKQEPKTSAEPPQKDKCTYPSGKVDG